MLAADLIGTTLHRLADPVLAGFAVATSLSTATAVVVVRFGVDALPAAIRLTVIALALALDAVVARLATIAARAAIVRIGFKTHALLIAAGISQASGRARPALLLFKFPSADAADLTTRESRGIAETMAVKQPLAICEAGDHDLPDLLLAFVAVANLGGCCVHNVGADRSTNNRRQRSTEHPFEQLATRRGRTELACEFVKAALLHNRISPRWRGTELPKGHGRWWHDDSMRCQDSGVCS
ncbi:MAG TPA: hypothetical protein VF201_08285 [Nitrolancea sp.]